MPVVLLLVLGMIFAVLPEATRAQQNVVLMELFTSQGCSSCPPADELLPEFAALPGVVALALHVDYWDYLGWKDTFGQAKFTKRQRGYSKAMRHRSIYTPQMIVQGETALVGHKGQKILDSVRQHQARPPKVALNVARTDGRLDIDVSSPARLKGPLDIHVVRYVPSHEVLIRGGENAGRTINYTNIVTDWTTVASWDGIEPATFSVDGYGEEGPLVVIVQERATGPVMAAAAFR